MPGMPGMRSELAVALSVLRQAKGWDQDELAAASGVGSSYLAKIEQGLREAPAGTLLAILGALGVDLATVDQQVALVRRVRAGADAAAAGVAAEGRQLERSLRAGLGGAAAPGAGLPLEESRRRAPGLWARLARYPHPARRALVAEAAEFQDAGFCELLCEKSVEAAGGSAKRALRLAQLAVLAAERVPGADGWQRRVEGYCRMHLSSALRVGGTLPAAAEALARAAELWQAGAGDDPGLLNEARVLQIEASLRRERRELPRALALLDRALAIDRWGETPSLLIGKAKALEELGDFAESIALLRQAAPLIDVDRDLVKLFSVHLNLAINLCHLGRHQDAALALPEVRALARRLGNRLDDLRVGWLEAKVAAGLGWTEEAVAGFERLRAGFEQEKIAYDVALVTLELAELHAAHGRTAEVKALARRAARIFEQQEVHREAQRALDLVRQAADEERATVKLLRAVISYLYRARHDPQLRFETTS
jgi:transcriptional regulator with XRE-family HTH domain